MNQDLVIIVLINNVIIMAENIAQSKPLSSDPLKAIQTAFENDIFTSIQHKYKQGHSYKRDPRKGLFRISQLPYCSRKLVFSNLLGWDADSYMQEAAEAGTMIHEIMQSALRENPNFKLINPNDMEIEDEVKFIFNSIEVTGHIDILVAIFQKMVLIIDIKTINGIENFDRFGAKKTHEHQVMLYCYALMKIGFDPSTFMPILWYVNRKNNTGDVLDLLNEESSRFHYFNYDESIATKILTKAENIYNLTKTFGKLPQIDAEEWECKNSKITCQYHELCYPVLKQTIAEIQNITLDSIKQRIERPKEYESLDLLAVRTENGLYYTNFGLEFNSETPKAYLVTFHDIGVNREDTQWIPKSQSEVKLIPLDLKTVIYENITVFKTNTALLLSAEQIERIFSAENKGIKINTLIIEKWLAEKKFSQLTDSINQKTAVINSKLFLMYKLFIKQMR